MMHPQATLQIGHRATATLQIGHKARASLRFVESPSGILRFTSPATTGAGAVSVKYAHPVLTGAVPLSPSYFTGKAEGQFKASPTTTLALVKAVDFYAYSRLAGAQLRTEGVTPAVLNAATASSSPGYQINPRSLAHAGVLKLPDIVHSGGGDLRLHKPPQVLPAEEEEGADA